MVKFSHEIAMELGDHALMMESNYISISRDSEHWIYTGNQSCLYQIIDTDPQLVFLIQLGF